MTGGPHSGPLRASLSGTKIAPLPTSHLGPYELLELLGAGGMGEVYRARDTRLDRIVAIKILPASAADDPEARQRFEREARTISQINHPHICTLHDVGRHEGTDYLVFEYLARRDARTQIVERFTTDSRGTRCPRCAGGCRR